MDELKDAAALLGPLLPNWQVQVSKDSLDKRGIYRFLDRDTGHLHDEDPRISESKKKSAMSEERSANRDARPCSTHRLTSSKNNTFAGQWLESEVLRKYDLPLQKFILS